MAALGAAPDRFSLLMGVISLLKISWQLYRLLTTYQAPRFARAL